MGISRKNKLLNKLHRQAVNGIFIFTGFCAIFLGYRIFRFVTVTQPMLTVTREQVEKELLSEGKPAEEDFSAA